MKTNRMTFKGFLFYIYFMYSILPKKWWPIRTFEDLNSDLFNFLFILFMIEIFYKNGLFNHFLRKKDEFYVQDIC